MRFEVPGDRVRDFSFPVPGAFSEIYAACREHGWARPSLFRKASLPTLQLVSPLSQRSTSPAQCLRFWFYRQCPKSVCKRPIVLWRTLSACRVETHLNA